jgi:hypothetical protein
MALKDTCKTMKDLLEGICCDLEKAEKGNKAASQRVRTGSIRLEKAAKLYRKESIKAEKSGTFKKAKASARKPAKPSHKAAKHKAAKRPTAKLPKKAPRR